MHPPTAVHQPTLTNLNQIAISSRSPNNIRQNVDNTTVEELHPTRYVCLRCLLHLPALSASHLPSPHAHSSLPDGKESQANIGLNQTGKQARTANPEEPARTKQADHSATQHHHQPTKMAAPVSEPNLGGSPPRNHQAPVQDAYSNTQADGHNRVAQAGHAAAHYAEADQNLAHKTKSKTKVPDENIVRLVAEENASKSKFPRYPGLERWELVEKMGDGAFSNVYRARDLEGNAGEVAIKVVRKFEMNNMQVRDSTPGMPSSSSSPSSFPFVFAVL